MAGLPRANGWLIRSHTVTGKTTTFICGLRSNGVTAPTLKKGDIVFIHNVSTHLVDGVEEAIEARGARVFDLPPYSPDFNPIEQLFAKLKSFLRKAKARTVERLWKAVASFLKTVSKGECKAYLANSGYA